LGASALEPWWVYGSDVASLINIAIIALLFQWFTAKPKKFAFSSLLSKGSENFMRNSPYDQMKVGGQ
jgi:hypothetical protein